MTTTDPSFDEMMPVHGLAALWAFFRREGGLHVSRNPWVVTFLPRELSDAIAEEPDVALGALRDLREEETEERRSQMRVVEDQSPDLPLRSQVHQISIERPHRTRPRPPRPPAA